MVLSPFQRFIPILAFYPQFSVLSSFQCFMVLSPFQFFIPISSVLFPLFIPISVSVSMATIQFQRNELTEVFALLVTCYKQ